MHFSVGHRAFVDGVTHVAFEGEELGHVGVGAHELAGVTVQFVAGLSLFVEDHAGAVGTFLSRERDVVDKARRGVEGSLLGGHFRNDARMHVGLSAFLGEGNLFLVNGTLHEEGFARTEDIAVVYGAVGYIAFTIGVPYGDGSFEVEEARVVEAGEGVTDEVPRTVVLKLAEVLFEGYFAVSGDEDGLSVDTFRKGLHVEVHAAPSEMKGITLTSLQHTVAAYIYPRRVHDAVGAVCTGVFADYPLRVGVSLNKVLHVHIEGHADKVPAVFLEGIHEVYVFCTHFTVHDETVGVPFRHVV